jgi:RNA polymerase sigma-70 factor (ECF subfamily)
MALDSRQPEGGEDMSETSSFAVLMQRLRSGEDRAAREVCERFTRQLVALARRQVAHRLAHKVDPEDVTQSALKSFFVRHRDGQLQVGDWAGLWSLLTLIVRRKCIDRVEFHCAARRDVGREVSAPLGRDQAWQHASDREPLPEEAVLLAETIEHLFRAADDDERPVLELSLQGWTAAEISLHLGRSLRTVQRLREQVRKRLELMRREQ